MVSATASLGQSSRKDLCSRRRRPTIPRRVSSGKQSSHTASRISPTSEPSRTEASGSRCTSASHPVPPLGIDSHFCLGNVSPLEEPAPTVSDGRLRLPLGLASRCGGGPGGGGGGSLGDSGGSDTFTDSNTYNNNLEKYGNLGKIPLGLASNNGDDLEGISFDAGNKTTTSSSLCRRRSVCCCRDIATATADRPKGVATLMVSRHRRHHGGTTAATMSSEWLPFMLGRCSSPSLFLRIPEPT